MAFRRCKWRQIWQNQKQRCYHPSNKSYKNLGAKGICMEYTFELFKMWCIKNVGDKKDFVIARIDRSKNFALDNLQVLSGKEFMQKAFTRHGGRNKRAVTIYNKNTGEVIHQFPSVSAAALFVKTSQSMIVDYCLKRRERGGKKGEMAFRYTEDSPDEDWWIKGCEATHPEHPSSKKPDNQGSGSGGT